MRVAILGDTHFGMRSDSLSFHNYYRKFFDTVFFPYLLEHGIKEIYQLGDLFDRRKFINYNSFHLSKQYFFNRIKEYGMILHTFPGNHDIFFKDILTVNSISLLLGSEPYMRIHMRPETIKIGDLDVDMVPWICQENEAEVMEFMRNSKSDVMLGHFEIAGFEMDRGNVINEGMSRSIFDKYDMVISGHYHHKSSDGTIFYVGTPGEVTWIDYQDERGFHIFDTEKRSLEFIKNPYSIFNKITYDDKVSDFEFWKAYDYEQLKDSYVKVVVLNKQNPYLFDTVLDNIYRASPADLSIVEDFTENPIEGDELINQAEDTFTILSSYIDGLTLTVDPDKLKTKMRSLYVEALNDQGNE